jgi:DNA replication protein DnaC
MAIDGTLMARARERLAQTKAENEAEHARRLDAAYARVPELREISRKQQQLFSGIVSAALRQGGDISSVLKQLDEESEALSARRAELLRSAGWPEDYLDEINACPLCHDSGMLRDGTTCSCLKRLYEAEQARELSSLIRLGQGDFADFDLGYYSTEPDPVYGISPREDMELVFNTCRRYALEFGKSSGNLLLRGGTGLGKTFLSACIAKTVAQRGFSVVYDTATAAFEAFETQRFSRDAGESSAAADRTRRILACDLFILDDLGTEMTTSFTQSALYTIVNTRLIDGKKTIVSTNLKPDELVARYSEQIMSRILGEYDTLIFLGSDIRAIKKSLRF